MDGTENEASEAAFEVTHEELDFDDVVEEMVFESSSDEVWKKRNHQTKSVISLGRTSSK